MCLKVISFMNKMSMKLKKKQHLEKVALLTRKIQNIQVT